MKKINGLPILIHKILIAKWIKDCWIPLSYKSKRFWWEGIFKCPDTNLIVKVYLQKYVRRPDRTEKVSISFPDLNNATATQKDIKALLNREKETHYFTFSYLKKKGMQNEKK